MRKKTKIIAGSVAGVVVILILIAGAIILPLLPKYNYANAVQKITDLNANNKNTMTIKVKQLSADGGDTDLNQYQGLTIDNKGTVDQKNQTINEEGRYTLAGKNQSYKMILDKEGAFIASDTFKTLLTSTTTGQDQITTGIIGMYANSLATPYLLLTPSDLSNSTKNWQSVINDLVKSKTGTTMDYYTGLSKLSTSDFKTNGDESTLTLSGTGQNATNLVTNFMSNASSESKSAVKSTLNEFVTIKSLKMVSTINAKKLTEHDEVSGTVVDKQNHATIKFDVVADSKKSQDKNSTPQPTLSQGTTLNQLTTNFESNLTNLGDEINSQLGAQ